jgi:hypothetical protein
LIFCFELNCLICTNQKRNQDCFLIKIKSQWKSLCDSISLEQSKTFKINPIVLT